MPDDPPADPPGGDPPADPTPPTGFDIKFSEIQDPETVAAVKQLLAEREVLKDEIGKTAKILKKMNDREEARENQEKRDSLLEELKDANEEMYEEYKASSDLDELRMAIKMAAKLPKNRGLAPYKAPDKGEDGKSKHDVPYRKDLTTGKPV